MYTSNSESKNSLLARYGHCLIPKETILYRSHPRTTHEDAMFFHLEYWLPSANDFPVQVWKTREDFQVIFLAKYLTNYGHAIESIIDLYYELFPNDSESLNDLGIKQYHSKKRQSFFNLLHDQHQVKGWLASLEGGHTLEICLFNKNTNQSLVTLKELATDKGDQYYQHSLKDLLVSPTKQFYAETNKKNKNYDYQQYLGYHEACVESAVENNVTRAMAEDRSWNLRMHLKI